MRNVTLLEVIADLERRAADAERVQAHAPVAAVLQAVLQDLRGVNGPSPAPAPFPDRLLTARQAADRLNTTVRWLYRHADQLPFARRLSARGLRFSETGLEGWLQRTR